MSLVGKQLGKYHILKPLGRGGMSRVYQAYHPQLDRYVAIKIMRQDLVEDEQFMYRFQREARSVANLRHPNIVQVFDFDIADEQTFMVMELLDGDSLKTRLVDYRVRGEKMPLGEVTSILLNVLDGLAYAHEEGMVHRDIKPANILLTQKGLAVLADFGIAHIVGSTRHTMSGALMGTLAYMAPEQGLKGQYDVRTDLYSLGVVLYEMLTQTPPYDADTPLAILMKHLNDPLPLELLEETAVPLPFQTIVMRALSKNPDDRYQTANEMADGLQNAISNLSIILPEKLPPPLSFTTNDAPSETVSVYSGDARDELVDASFADDATRFTLNDLSMGSLKALEKGKEVMTAVDDSPSTHTVQEVVHELVDGRSGSPVTSWFFMTIGWNMAAVFLSLLFDQWDIYGRGWSFNLFILGWGLSLFARGRYGRRFFYFLSTALLGWGWMLTYSAIFDDWELWADIWPGAIAVLIIAFFVSRRFHFKTVHSVEKFQKALMRHRRFAIVSAAIVFAMALTISP